MGKFIISKRKNHEYQFVLKAANGETILVSEGYTDKAGCKNGITSVKENAPLDERYQRKHSIDGQFYFNLEAKNGEIIGTSEMYQQTSGRENGIEAVKINAPTATEEDIS